MHTVTAPLRVGEMVQGDVDWPPQAGSHAAAHGRAYCQRHRTRQFGYDNVGFHIGAKDVTVDFSGPLTDAELAEWNALPTGDMAERARDDSLARAFGAGAANYRSKKELTGAYES